MQGFIFFFTAEKLRKSIISVHHSFVMRGQHVTYMILDFRMVDEVDTRNQN
jgi:MFS superfamily sulfate permease-like transporter